MLDFKKAVDTGSLYITNAEEYEFLWRPLTISEYKLFSSLRSNSQLGHEKIYSEVFDLCYMGDSDLISGNVPAGLTISIGRYIMYIAGDCEVDLEAVKVDIFRARERYLAASVTEVMKRIIFTAFPQYKPEDFKDWTRQKLIDTFVLSESILQERYDKYKPLDLNKITDKPEKQGLPFNLNKENRDLNKAMGPRGIQRSEDPYLEDAIKKGKVRRAKSRKVQ